MRTRTRFSVTLAAVLFPSTVLSAGSPEMRTPVPPTLQTSAASARLYDVASRKAQYDALRAMTKVDVQYGKAGRVQIVEGSTRLFPAVRSLKPGDAPARLLQQVGPLLMATSSDGLRVKSVEDRKLRSGGFEPGGHDVFLEQTVNGLPVIDAPVNLRTTETGELIVISSRFVPAADVSKQPVLGLKAVRQIVLHDLVEGGVAATGSIQLSPGGQLAYWTADGTLDRPVLVWQLQAIYRTPNGETESAVVSANAATGEVHKLEHTAFDMRRIVYSLNNHPDTTVPWQLLWDEAVTPLPNYGDSHAAALYNNVGKARNFWSTVGWNYETLNLIVHWGITNNAAYDVRNGIPSIFAGDLLAQDLDAASHEYGHGVFSQRAPSQPLAWWAEWNAINEFYGDVSAVFTDMAERGGAMHNPETWHISSLNGQPLRDLAYPKNPVVYAAVSQLYEDWYPKRAWCCNRSAVSHRNMTIFGHALYLMRHGGVHGRAGARWSTGPFSFSGDTIPVIPVVAIPDNTLLKQIFVQGLANMRIYNATVDGPNLKWYTSSVAHSLGGPTLQANVNNAWRAVGIDHTCTAPPPPPDYILRPGFCKGRYNVDWAQSPGVTYHAQVVHQLYPWDTYGQTQTDGEVDRCRVNVPWPSRFRMRACNGCGCSTWTPDAYQDYWNTCQ
jgi:Zn-dependent metalloprotease